MTPDPNKLPSFWINELDYHSWYPEDFPFGGDVATFIRQYPGDNVHTLIQTASALSAQCDKLSYDLGESYARSPQLNSEEFYQSTQILERLKRSVVGWKCVDQVLDVLSLDVNAQNEITKEAMEVMTEVAAIAQEEGQQLHCFSIVLKGIAIRFLFIANAYGYIYEAQGMGFKKLADFRVYDTINALLIGNWGVSTLHHHSFKKAALSSRYLEACSALFTKLASALDLEIPATRLSLEFRQDIEALKRHIDVLARDYPDQLPGNSIAKHSPAWLPWFKEHWTQNDVMRPKFAAKPDYLATNINDDEL